MKAIRPRLVRDLAELKRGHGIHAILTPDFDRTEAWLLEHGRPGDLVLTMGCGNINLLNDQMQQHWDNRQPPLEG